MIRFDEWLTAIRKREGLTQQELSERSGMARPSICNYETGRTDPGLYAAERLLNAMGYGLKVVKLNANDNNPAGSAPAGVVRLRGDDGSDER